MKRNLLFQVLLFQLGITTAYGQVNLSDMAIASSNSLQKSKDYFSRTIVRRNRIRDYPEVNCSILLISFTKKQIKKI